MKKIYVFILLAVFLLVASTVFADSTNTTTTPTSTQTETQPTVKHSQHKEGPIVYNWNLKDDAGTII